MSLLLGPRQLQCRAELYQQLSQLTAAGVGLINAMEMQWQHPPTRSFRAPLRTITQLLTAGATFHDALVATGRWMPAFDIALLHAGEQSGRLPTSFKLLAGHYEATAGLLRKTLSGMLYPALLLHMAVATAFLPDFFKSWDLSAFVLRFLCVLAPVYAIVGGVSYALQGDRGERWRSVTESVLNAIPLFGAARRNLSLARLASALEALVAAGVSIIDAWEIAGAASGSPALRRAVLAWKPDLLSGVTPAEALRQSGRFPELFCNLYHTGELTGSLEDTLRKLHILYYDEGSHQLQAVAEWTPRLVYLGVALLVAVQVVRAWSNYFNQINQVIGQ